MKKIAVIGAGLSGTLVTINLLEQVSRDHIIIYWIDRNSESEMGFAYSTKEDYLLNVPVELMSAFSRDPKSFLKWSRVRDRSVKTGAYLPRRLYREYILEMLNNAVKGKKENIHLERIRDLATDVEVKNSQIKVCLQRNGSIETDKIVLAIGNPLPGNPVCANMEYIHDRRYIQNPWNPDILENLSKNDTIVFIGTGQTMVDLVTGLYRKKHKGRLIAISRRGILPMSQKKVAPYPSFYDEIKELTAILPLFQVVRKHLKIAGARNLDPRSVIDSLRPYTSALWMKLPPEEKQRFLRHLFRYWEIIRSRIPPASEKIINELIGSGQLKIIAGRMYDIIPSKDAVHVNFTEKDSTSERTLSADYIINCKGPDLDYEKNEQPLVKSLIKAKLIECDPVHIGINALPEGNVLSGGKASEIIFTIGPPLKGIVWESIATPEIRVYAENLARNLINTDSIEG